eukprot:scaffold23428_cov86-Isochrysis_galbana.AAC.2
MPILRCSNSEEDCLSGGLAQGGTPSLALPSCIDAHLARGGAYHHHPRPRRSARPLSRRLLEERQESLADTDGPEIVDGGVALEVAEGEPVDEATGADAGVVHHREEGVVRG